MHQINAQHLPLAQQIGFACPLLEEQFVDKPLIDLAPIGNGVAMQFFIDDQLDQRLSDMLGRRFVAAQLGH
ncbi:MAG: hypothetical protein ABI068_05200 [Ktedonobacterales bacterium]